MSEKRRLILLNATGADTAFALLARPDALEGMPDSSARPLAWMVATVPGRGEGLSYRHVFTWTERPAFLLGRLSREAAPNFCAEAVVRVPDRGKRTAVLGFVGSAGHGAAKVLRFEPGGEGRAVLRADDSFPSFQERTVTTRGLAAAWAVDPDDDGNGGALLVPLHPNGTTACCGVLHYWITPVQTDVAAGDLLASDLTGSAHPLAFDAATTLRLTFTERNVFSSTEDGSTDST